MKTIYYVAYGSNLNLDHFLKRCPSAKFLGSSILVDKALAFKGDEEEFSYLTIEEEVGSIVPIGIFELSYFDSLKLDKYEGYPVLYSKDWIDIKLNGSVIKAMIYIIRPKYDYHLPSLKYFNSCLKGYDYFNFDREYLVDAIKRTNLMLENKNEETRN